MNNKKITTTLPDGTKKEFDVIFTFKNENNDKDYIVYTDNSTDDDGNVRVYASIFDPNKEKTELIPIETDREWKIIETILDTIQEDNKNINEDDDSSK